MNAKATARWLGLAALLGGLVVVVARTSPDDRAGTARKPSALTRNSGTPSNREFSKIQIEVSDARLPDSSDRIFAKFPWGTGLNELGRILPSEGNPQGPMSFALKPDGSAVILDQVNARLLLTDPQGRVTRDIRIDLRAAQEVAFARDGTIAVTDRLADKRVALFDASGRPTGSLPLEGKGVAEGGAVTGVFADGKGFYAEREHGPLVYLGDTQGGIDGAGTELAGRPSRDGRMLLTAGITNAAEGRTWLAVTDRATRKHLFTREYRFGTLTQAMLGLDSDAQGVAYFFVSTPNSTPNSTGATTGTAGAGIGSWLGVCVSEQDGHVLGAVAGVESSANAEIFREFVVSDDGRIVHAELREEGVSYREYHCP